MNISKRNKKVALSRWSKIHSKEVAKILNTEEGLILKSKICGFLAGDGSVQVRKDKKGFYHYQLDFFADDEIMKQTYINLISTVYNKMPSCVIRDNCIHARLTSKTIVQDLIKLADFSTKKWTLPYSLFHINGTIEKWLNGFFSAEAYVSDKQIRIQTINKEGMLQVSELLTKIDIKNRTYYYSSKKINESDVTIIVIGKKDSRLKFLNIVGFSHSKKNSKLAKSLNL